MYWHIDVRSTYADSSVQGKARARMSIHHFLIKTKVALLSLLFKRVAITHHSEYLG